MKKRILPLLLALVVCLPILCTLAAGTDTSDIYQLAINDHFFDAELNASTMPIKVSGVIYVPYTVFDREVAQADFQISYGQRREGGEYTLSLYSINGTLIFDLNRGTTTDTHGNSVSMRAILNNGRPFVPIQAVCNYFNTLAGTTLIQYVYTDTEYGALIRLRNREASLSDFMFRQSALSYMQYRANKYLQSQAPQSSAPVTSPATPVSPSATPSQTDEEQPGQSDTVVYLAFRCGGAGGLTDILDTLEREGITALFLFQPQQLEAQADLVRQVVGRGHSLGLLVSGTSARSALESLDQGNTLLKQIVWTRTRIALADGADSQVEQALEEAGWHCWQGNVDGTTGTSAVSRANRTFASVEEQRRTARITMDDTNTSADALERLIARLKEEGYGFRATVETEI